MGHGTKSKKLYIRQYEFVGDGFLNFHTKRMLVNEFPMCSMECLNNLFHYVISNELLERYATYAMLKNANNVEVEIGKLVQYDEVKALELVESIIKFAIAHIKNLKLIKTDFVPIKYSFGKEVEKFKFTPLDIVYPELNTTRK
jgi:hypothetical protein